MRKLIKMELKRMLDSKALRISILIGVAICIWLLIIELHEVSTLERMVEQYGVEKLGLYYPRSLFNSFIGLEFAYLPSSLLYAILPMLVVIPFSASFYYEKKSGYLKNILLRCNRFKYYAAKYIVVFISGAIVVLSILGFSFLVSAMFFPALPPEIATSSFSPQNEQQLLMELYVTHPMIYTLLYSMIDVVFYALIATIPLTLAIFIQSSVTVLVAPLVIYVTVSYALTALGAIEFSPMNFLRPCQIFVNASGTIILIESVMLLLITGYIFIHIGGRKDVL